MRYKFNDNFREAVLDAIKLDEAALEAEMQTMDPHVFSDEFEEKMKKIMLVRKRKIVFKKAILYAAACMVVLLLTGAIFFVGSEELSASEFSIDIIDWLENFFVVDEGTKIRREEGVLFQESQIGYMPEGFEKVEEYATFSKVNYRYQNADGLYVTVEVCRDKLTSMIDNEEIKHGASINEAGFEYRYIYKEDSKENVVTWEDRESICYYVYGTLEKEDVIEVMDGIIYLEE